MRRRCWTVALALLLTGCSGPERVEPAEGAKPHLAEQWYSWRATALGITAAECLTRDEAIAEDRPPATIDRQSASEAATVFRVVCAQCHGREGTPPETQPGGGPAPRAFGTFGMRMGFFFGGDRMRAGLYRTIRRGGKPPEDGAASNMAAWSSVLSREQTWALVRHLESF